MQNVNNSQTQTITSKIKLNFFCVSLFSSISFTSFKLNTVKEIYSLFRKQLEKREIQFDFQLLVKQTLRIIVATEVKENQLTLKKRKMNRKFRDFSECNRLYGLEDICSQREMFFQLFSKFNFKIKYNVKDQFFFN